MRSRARVHAGDIEPSSRQAIYLGRTSCDAVVKERGSFVAIDATGAQLGKFKTRAEAVGAILEATRREKGSER